MAFSYKTIKETLYLEAFCCADDVDISVQMEKDSVLHLLYVLPRLQDVVRRRLGVHADPLQNHLVRVHLVILLFFLVHNFEKLDYHVTMQYTVKTQTENS
jgi:hypothetical protein